MRDMDGRPGVPCCPMRPLQPLSEQVPPVPRAVCLPGTPPHSVRRPGQISQPCTKGTLARGKIYSLGEGRGAN